MARLSEQFAASSSRLRLLENFLQCAQTSAIHLTFEYSAPAEASEPLSLCNVKRNPDNDEVEREPSKREIKIHRSIVLTSCNCEPDLDKSNNLQRDRDDKISNICLVIPWKVKHNGRGRRRSNEEKGRLTLQ